MNNFRALIVAWLDASQRSRDNVRLNRFNREHCVRRLRSSYCAIRTFLFGAE